MKKLDLSAIKERLKNLLRFGRGNKSSSNKDFEYDDTDSEVEAEDYLSDETYEGYEESDSDELPPMQMPGPEYPEHDSQDIDDDLYDTAHTTPNKTAPKEFKIGRLGQSKGSWKEKLAARFSFGTAKIKSKMTRADEHSTSAPKSFKAIKDWWNKLGGEYLLQRPFSPDIRPTLHHAFLWLIFATVAVQGGKMLALLLMPKSQTNRPIMALSTGEAQKLDIDTIARSDIFGARGDVRDQTLVVKNPINKNIICKAASQKSSLPIELLNTVVLKDSVKSIASVQNRGSREFLNVREGDKVQNLAEVGKIDRLKVIVKNLSSGECEFIESNEKEVPTRGASPIKVVSPSQGRQIINQQQDTGIRNEGNRFTIKKSMRDELLTNNMSEILTQARAVQIKRPDGTLAFKMTEIVPGSIYAKLNIQDGDVITGINGKSFNSLNEVMTLFSQVREIDNFQISMEREGTEQNMEYNFE